MQSTSRPHLKILKGGGDFEIAVDQQTRVSDRTIKGVPESGCPPAPAGQPRPYLEKFWLNLPNHLKMLAHKLVSYLNMGAAVPRAPRVR